MMEYGDKHEGMPNKREGMPNCGVVYIVPYSQRVNVGGLVIWRPQPDIMTFSPL